MGFVANFICLPAVQKFWKSVKIWQSCRVFKGGNFFWDTVYISTDLTMICLMQYFSFWIKCIAKNKKRWAVLLCQLLWSFTVFVQSNTVTLIIWYNTNFNIAQNHGFRDILSVSQDTSPMLCCIKQCTDNVSSLLEHCLSWSNTAQCDSVGRGVCRSCSSSAIQFSK